MFRKIVQAGLPIFILLMLPLAGAGQTKPKDASPKKDPGISRSPTAADVLRSRISRAKALLAARNYAAAVYELESIKRQSRDPEVRRVLNVLLMNSYLEEGDFANARKLLARLKDSSGPKASDYFAVAGQVVSGARKKTERYRELGLSVANADLPPAAVSDIENMRKTLELVISQTKTLAGNDRIRATAVALVEESSSARRDLARDDYDARLWSDQIADAREEIVGDRSLVLDAVSSAPADMSSDSSSVAASVIEKKPVSKPASDKLPEPKSVIKKSIGPPPAESVTTKKPVASKAEETKTVTSKEDDIADRVDQPAGNEPLRPTAVKNKRETISTDRPVRVIRSAEKTSAEKERSAAAKRSQPNVRSTITGRREPRTAGSNTTDAQRGPLPVGSLIGYATRRVNPVYPRQARNLRMSGIVTVKVLVDENGRVAGISDANGPALLKRAATDAVRKWRFRPFRRDGKPIQVTGFVSFNFHP